MGKTAHVTPRNRNYKNLGQNWEGKKSSNKEIIFFFPKNSESYGDFCDFGVLF